MSCERHAEEMSAFLDGYPSDAFEAHLAVCPGCRRELEALRQADDALRTCSALPWRREMTEAILARATSRRWRLGIIPIAAALLAGLAALLAWPRGRIRPEELASHVAAVELVARAAERAPQDAAILCAGIRQVGLLQLTERLQARPAPRSVRQYLEATSDLVRDAKGWPFEESQRSLRALGEKAAVLKRDMEIPPGTVEIPAAPAGDEVALFATAQLQLASGRGSRGVQTFNRLIEGRPGGPYAHLACVALGRHHLENGDALAALQTYSLITAPGVITEDVAASIKKAGAEAGTVYVGSVSLQSLDAGALRTRVAMGEPYTVVRRDEILILGTVDQERLRSVQSRNAAAIREVGSRRAVVNRQGLSERDALELDLTETLRRAAAK